MKCEYCNKDFETKRKKNFCSKECRYKFIGQKVSLARTNPEFQEKLRQRNLEKYGVEHPMQIPSIKEKVKNTQIERYGDYSLHLNKPDYKTREEKRKKSFISKHGVDNPFKLKEFQEKAQTTKQLRYGKTPFLYGSEEFNQNMIDKYGEDWKARIINKSQHNGFGMVSKLNRAWQELLKQDTGINFTIEKNCSNVVGKFSYDLRYKNLLIEINPSISHNTAFNYAFTTGRQEENKPISKDYHYLRWINAKENNCTLLSYFDWYDDKKFIDIVKAKLNLLPNRCYARSTTLKEISQTLANQFLNSYHIQGKASGQTVCLGLFLDNELLQIMTFGKPRFDKKYDWELIRLCTKEDWQVIGGKSKLLKYFLNNYSGSLISYNNNNISTEDGEYIPSFGLWFNPKTGKLFNNNAVLAKGASRLIGDKDFTKYQKGTSNEEILLNEGYLPFYDCGSSKQIIRK